MQFQLVNDDFDVHLPTTAPVEGNGNYPKERPKERRDGSSEIELGEFLTKDGEDGEIEMSVLQTKGCHRKGGLVVEGIEIRPKDGKEQCLYAGHINDGNLDVDFHTLTQTQSKGQDSPDFSTLPEGCIASIVSLTSPADVCRLASVSPNFKSVCDSNVVWALFLPLDCRQITSRSFSSLKELYFSLCDEPVLISDGTMSFSLDRHSGKKCIMLSARALSISWGDNPDYWSWYHMPSSRFAEVAELFHVWWFEIRGTISSCMLSPGTLYAAYLVFNYTKIFQGFDFPSVKVGVGFAGDEAGKLAPDGTAPKPAPANPALAPAQRALAELAPAKGNGNYPKERRDGWLEIELGEFLTKDGEDGEVEMSVMETKGAHWKSGLVVEGIEIRPKDGKEKCLYARRV
ncbi:hypothetical protein BT93_H1047 [Corymbia citriodora subsp. variegata]|nr:hypothetical protein BT93_H1047 [Corymbia citriodora subsp. variegata]